MNRKIKREPTASFQPYKNVFIGLSCIEKFCTKCKRNREIAKHFSKDPDRRYGYYSQCNDCLRSYGQIFRQRKLELSFDGSKVKRCACGLLYTAIKMQAVLEKCQTCIRGKNV